jgi:hypothetical protein
MEVPTALEVLAAYARTAMEPVRSPATAAPAMTALDGFMVQFSFGFQGLISSALVKQESTEAWFLPFPARDFLCQSKEAEIEWGGTRVR